MRKLEGGRKVDQNILRRITIWLAGSLMHTCAQRPGAIVNMTLEEYQAASLTVVGRTKYKSIRVANHKNGTTGSTRITAGPVLTNFLDQYVTKIRPLVEGADKSNLIFPNRVGKAIDHLSRHVKALADRLHVNIPVTATTMRHAAATAVAECNEGDKAAVATTISHSKRSQDVYYIMKKGKADAIKGLQVLERVRSEKACD